MKVLKVILNVCKGIIIFGGGIIAGAAGMYIFILHGLVNDRSFNKRPSYYNNYYRRRA